MAVKNPEWFCLGNICRSPWRKILCVLNFLEDFIVDSAGTGGWHAGELPDKRSISTAKNRGFRHY